jgi:hypothetical protein
VGELLFWVFFSMFNGIPRLPESSLHLRKFFSRKFPPRETKTSNTHTSQICALPGHYHALNQVRTTCCNVHIYLGAHTTMTCADPILIIILCALTQVCATPKPSANGSLSYIYITLTISTNGSPTYMYNYKGFKLNTLQISTH